MVCSVSFKVLITVSILKGCTWHQKNPVRTRGILVFGTRIKIKGGKYFCAIINRNMLHYILVIENYNLSHYS